MTKITIDIFEGKHGKQYCSSCCIFNNALKGGYCDYFGRHMLQDSSLASKEEFSETFFRLPECLLNSKE